LRAAALSDDEASELSGDEQVPAQKPTKDSKAKADPIEADDDEEEEEEEEEDEYADVCFQTGYVSLTERQICR
jgi:hypothetical protein